MSDAFSSLRLTAFEKILIVSGLLFFANVVYMALGGGFVFNYAAKGVYLVGIVILLHNLYQHHGNG